MNSSEENTREHKAHKKKMIQRIIILIAIAAAVTAAVNIIWISKQKENEKNIDEQFVQAMQSYAPSKEPVQTTAAPISTTEASLLERTRKESDRQIDFNGLIAGNTDVFAWICIPGTDIDYPVVHCDTNTYYLSHNALKEESKRGAIFSDMQNLRGIGDPHIVLYGHRMKNGSMFAQLLKYKDKAFFDEYQIIEMYTPEGKWEYKIFAAYVRDDKNILNGVDWTDKQAVSAYLDSVNRMHDLNANSSGMQVTAEDNILTLSTCVEGEANQRFVVQAVLR